MSEFHGVHAETGEGWADSIPAAHYQAASGTTGKPHLSAMSANNTSSVVLLGKSERNIWAEYW